MFVNACEFLYGVVTALSVDSSIAMFLMNCVDVLCREKIVGTRFYSYRKHRPDASVEVVTPISISSQPFFKAGYTDNHAIMFIIFLRCPFFMA